MNISRVLRFDSVLFSKFALVGLSNSLISYSAFIFLFNIFNIATLAQLLAYCCGILWSYFLNSRWTFGNKDYSAKSWVRFAILQIGLMLISAACIGILVDRWLLSPTYSWLCVMSLATLVNYFLSNHWVFAADTCGDT